MTEEKLSASVMSLKREALNIITDETNPLNAVVKRILDDEDFMTATVDLFCRKEDMSEDVTMAMQILLNPTVFKGRILGVIGLVIVMLDLNPNEVK